MKIIEFKQIFPYIVFLSLGFFFFPSAGTDDNFITYWAAYTLSHFGEIVNYNGERIEQSSSLLHSLILAAFHYFSKFKIENIGNILSIFFGLVSLYCIGKLSQILRQDQFATTILAATSVPLLYWSFGALETSLLAAIVLVFIIAIIRFLSAPTKKHFFYKIFKLI